MPTGPKATSERRVHSRSLSKAIRETEVLLGAWQAIRQNGETSRSPRTREETRSFGSDLPRQLRRIQERLRKSYQFSPQIGATPEKAKGKGKRPLVIAPIADRIVQRAILDLLQGARGLAEVQRVLATPTSIGGIPGRGVEDAINIIEKVNSQGNANFVAGSDISGFFTKIRQAEVVDFVQQKTKDAEFSDLFSNALKVELANANEMDPEDLKMFPANGVGVAQGCPLSAFAGNVALRSFDAELNGRGITCLRYIDDFILLGRKKDAVRTAFESADKHLKQMSMSIYQPDQRPDKAFFGPITDEFEFLGYKLVPGVYPPSDRNKQRLLESLRQEMNEGRNHILRSLNGEIDKKPLQLYAQTLVAVDKVLRAWSGSFRASRCKETAAHLDNEINELLSGFIGFYREKTEGRPIIERRRALGIHILADDVRLRLQSDSAKTKS